mgnify:CR=1 FL=1
MAGGKRPPWLAAKSIRSSMRWAMRPTPTTPIVMPLQSKSRVGYVFRAPLQRA